MAFKRGAKAAQEAAEKNTQGGGFDRVQYLKFDENVPVRVRLLHDGHEWYYAAVHSYTPLREPHPDWSEKRRAFYTDKQMSATCRHDENIDADECYICDVLHTVKPNEKTKDYKSPKLRGKYLPQVRYFIPVVIRKPVECTEEMILESEKDPNPKNHIPRTRRRGGEEISTIGQIIGWDDETETVDEIGADGQPTGSKVRGPMIRLIEHGYKNSIITLQNLWEMSDEGTLLDRDVVVVKKGERKDTEYLWTEKERTPHHDLSDPEQRAKYHIPDIEKLILERASEEYYARFFDHRAEFPTFDDEKDDSSEGGNAKAADQAPAAQTAEDAAAAEEMAALRAKFLAGATK